MQYVPVMKGKEGEYKALSNLSVIQKKKLMPLIEMTDLPYDHEEERHTRTADEHTMKFIEKLLGCWTAKIPIAIDVPDSLAAAELGDGSLAITRIATVLGNAGFHVLPTIDLGKPKEYLAAVKVLDSVKEIGVCVRVYANDLGNPDIPKDVDALLKAVGVSAKEATLVLDMGAVLPQQETTYALAVQGAIAILPYLKEWKTLALIASAFPRDLSAFLGDTVSATPRTEWLGWKIISAGKLPRHIIFGDYTISHPDGPADIDPRLMTMSASLRYTDDSDWIILKGRAIKKKGSGQYADKCRELLKMSAYRGPGFSKGDEMISNCAKGITTGPGNATTWRQAGISHHLAVVIDQTSSGSTRASSA